MQEIIKEAERIAFKRCRRAWDLGSRSRRNLEPLVPAQAFNLEKAIHDALAIWYFPGMWEWDRELVRSVAMEGFHKSMRRQLEAYQAVAAVSGEQDEGWLRSSEEGEALLERYFSWAPGVDAFSPVRVDTDFDVNIPDPDAAGADLVGPTGPIRYQGRVDALVVDAYDAYWIMDHRLTRGEWETETQLLLDERGVAACWAWEIFYYGMKIAGTVYNELRIDATPAQGEEVPGDDVPGEPSSPGEVMTGRRRLYMEASRMPERRVEVFGNEAFRRTRITRTREELAACGRQLAVEAREMTAPGLVAYPSPSLANCGPCLYRSPCLAMNSGADVDAILGTAYRDRGPEEVEEGRLGAVTWSMNRGARPPRFG